MMVYDTEPFFDTFSEECEFWLSKFNLYNWHVRVLLSKEAVVGTDGELCLNDDIYGNLGICSVNKQNRTADITLNKSWNIEPTDYEIRRVAFHEVCELFFARAGFLAFDAKANENDWEEEVHSMIRTLENSVFHGSRVLANEQSDVPAA